jgi:IclR family transcriptional regulator, KDG regulon repressor
MIPRLMKSVKATNIDRKNELDGKTKASYIVPAVDRAIRILSLLKSEKREMTIAEIAEATGWNKSSIYKLLLTLDHHGLLTRDLVTKKYSLGIALMDYGRAVLNGFEIRHAAKPSLKELARYTGESVAVSILSGTQMTLVEVEESVAQVRIALSVGMTKSATATSHGKAVLAHLPESRLEEILRVEGLPGYTKKSLTNPGVYRKALEVVRKQGYAVECEEFEEGLAGISAPVFSANGVVGALLIVLPSFKLTKEKSRLFGKKCAEEAARVSALLQ